MRICHVSTEVAGFRGGGIGTYVVEAGRALRGAGHEVWLVTWDPGPGKRDALRCHDAFDRVLFVEEAEDDPDRYRFALARDAYRFSSLAHRALATAGVAFDWIEFPDYEAPGYVPVLEHRLFDAHGDAVLAVTLHSPTWECAQFNGQLHNLTPTQREVCVLEEDAIRRAPLRLCPSRRLRDMVTERLGLDPEGTRIVRYPMALPEEPPAPPRARGSLRELRFAYFGRIEPRKGVHNLVEAFRLLPDLRLELIGDDRPSSPLGTSNVAWLRRHAPPNVAFRPGLERDALLRHLPEIDVCVLPSLWENWPNACIEAMAAGRVVLGGRNGGMAEMIEHGRSGFLVDGSDPADIARVVREDLGAALGRLDAIGAEAARRIRELSDPRGYAATIARLRTSGGAPVCGGAPVPGGRKVSIVVPFYREDETLVGAAVDSALGQTHEDLEVLVVEDGSPRADARAILDRVAAKDTRVRVLSKPNGGLASARNFAIRHATGDFVLCLDADNLLRPEYAATALEVLDRCPEAVAVVPEMRKFDGATGATLLVSNPLPFARSLAFFRNESGDAGAVFRAAVFREHGLAYDSAVDAYSDWALWLDCARLGLVVQCIPRVLYDYRVHQGSMMARDGWDRHLALLGLLVERHWLPGTEEEHRDTVLALVQGWGAGALLAALGGRAEYWERPTEAARRMRENVFRYKLADAVANVAGRIPGLERVLRPVLAELYRRHGRLKARRTRFRR